MTTIPNGWEETSVARYIDDPYSAAALAETHKTYIDLGPVAMDACTDSMPGVLKNWGKEPNIPNDVSPELRSTHERFIAASRVILGEQRFLRSSMSFTHRYGGQNQAVLRPHLDGTIFEAQRANRLQMLRLVGIACTAPTTTLFQGSLSLESLDEHGSLKSLRNLGKRFKREPLPADRLILMAPATLHEGVHASSATEHRLFMRWFLSV